MHWFVLFVVCGIGCAVAEEQAVEDQPSGRIPPLVVQGNTCVCKVWPPSVYGIPIEIVKEIIRHPWWLKIKAAFLSFADKVKHVISWIRPFNIRSVGQ